MDREAKEAPQGSRCVAPGANALPVPGVPLFSRWEALYEPAMRAAEVIVFEGADPQVFSRIDAIARERALEGLADYNGFESMSVFEDPVLRTIHMVVTFATDHDRLTANLTLEQISRVVALASGAKDVRRFGCRVFRARKRP